MVFCRARERSAYAIEALSFVHGPRKKVPKRIWATVANYLNITQLNLKNPQLVKREKIRPVIKEPKAAGMIIKSSSSLIDALTAQSSSPFGMRPFTAARSSIDIYTRPDPGTGKENVESFNP